MLVGLSFELFVSSAASSNDDECKAITKNKKLLNVNVKP